MAQDLFIVSPLDKNSAADVSIAKDNLIYGQRSVGKQVFAPISGTYKVLVNERTDDTKGISVDDLIINGIVNDTAVTVALQGVNIPDGIPDNGTIKQGDAIGLVSGDPKSSTERGLVFGLEMLEGGAKSAINPLIAAVKLGGYFFQEDIDAAIKAGTVPDNKATAKDESKQPKGSGIGALVGAGFAAYAGYKILKAAKVI